jgi:8-oxo-dGTP pyrophosphatase MutT (NUDIX family)
MNELDYLNKKNILCGNCGKEGHTYRYCKEPVISLGIICYKKINKKFMYLLIRRKDTLGFIEFLRGKYDIENKSYIKKLFLEMTYNEVNRILTLEFDVLWEDLWMDQNTKQFKNEYVKSKEKFITIINDSIIDIKGIVKDIELFWNEPEWGFPKGRRNIRENDMDCALREFTEETGYNKEEISILQNINPIEETFYGSNNVRYKHIYFLAQANTSREPTLNYNNKNQISEISKIKWFTYEKSLKVLRPYNKEKINVLKNINNILNHTIKINNLFTNIL